MFHSNRRLTTSAASASSLKRSLLKHLKQTVYVKLAPGVAGVGVVALRDIPPGTNPFAPANQQLLPKEKSVALTESELQGLPTAVREHVFDFFAAMDDPRDESAGTPLRTDSSELVYGVHACGPNALDISWYVNHSDEPNLEFVMIDGEGDFNSYRTTRLVVAGEELLHNYRTSFPFLYQRCVAGGESTGGGAVSEAAAQGGGEVLKTLRRALEEKLAEHEAAAIQIRLQLLKLDE